MEVYTGEHCNGINVMKTSIAFPFKTCPKIGDKDLRPLVKPNHLAFEENFDFEARKTLHDQVDQSCGGALGYIDAIEEAAIKVLVVQYSLRAAFTRQAVEGLTSERILPTSRRHEMRSSRSGIWAVVADLKTCLKI